MSQSYLQKRNDISSDTSCQSVGKGAGTDTTAALLRPQDAGHITQGHVLMSPTSPAPLLAMKESPTAGNSSAAFGNNAVKDLASKPGFHRCLWWDRHWRRWPVPLHFLQFVICLENSPLPLLSPDTRHHPQRKKREKSVQQRCTEQESWQGKSWQHVLSLLLPCQRRGLVVLDVPGHRGNRKQKRRKNYTGTAPEITLTPSPWQEMPCAAILADNGMWYSFSAD